MAVLSKESTYCDVFGLFVDEGQGARLPRILCFLEKEALSSYFRQTHA